jgi:hypothetical protein
MGQTGKLRIILEIERGSEPIAGTLTARDGEGREFCGWTALATTIEWALDPPSIRARPGREPERQPQP